MEQSADHDDEVRQFVSELKSRAASASESPKQRLTQSVPGRRLAVDRKRPGNGNLPRQDHATESPTSSPRTRRSNPTDRPPAPAQRSFSPRGRPVEAPLAAVTGSPTQRRSIAAKKPPVGIGSPPTPRGGARPKTAAPARPHLAPPPGPARSPWSSPRKDRAAGTATGRLAAVDDDQARSSSDSDSLLTQSGGSSDDQEPAAPAPGGRLATRGGGLPPQDPAGPGGGLPAELARPPTTPTLARRQRIDMTQMLLVKPVPDQSHSPGGATAGVRQVRVSPTAARRAASHRYN